MFEVTITSKDRKFETAIASIATELSACIRGSQSSRLRDNPVFVNIITAHNEALMETDIIVKVMVPFDGGIEPFHYIDSFIRAIEPICVQNKISFHIVVVAAMLYGRTHEIKENTDS